MSKITLKWHGMICPDCHTDDGLYVIFQGEALLTQNGTEYESDHEWDNDSHCRCRNCGFAGPARLFQGWGNEGEVVDFNFWPDEEKISSFEIVVYGMAKNEDGAFMLASELGVEPEFWDAHLTRRTLCAGGRIDILEEHENLTRDVMEAVVCELERKYPFASLVNG